MSPRIERNANEIKFVQDMLDARGKLESETVRAYTFNSPNGEEVILLDLESNTLIGNQEVINRFRDYLDGLQIFGSSSVPETNSNPATLTPPKLKKEEVVEQSIKILNLPARTLNALERSGVSTFEHLIKIAESEDAKDELLTTKYFGEDCFDKTLTALMNIEGIKFDKSLKPDIKRLSKQKKT